MATVEVVPPNICKEVDIGEGIVTPTRERKIPDTIDIISGFFESLRTTFINPVRSAEPSSLYNSKTVIEIATLRGEIEADASVARCSPCRVGKANIMKGIPKKDKLPKIVLKMSR